MQKQKNNRRRGHRRVMALWVVCALVFAVFLARLVQMQFLLADEYAAKAAAVRTASYTVAQNAARGAITDRDGVILAEDETTWDVYLRIPSPPGTALEETTKTLQSLTGGKDVETQLAAFLSAASAGELLAAQDLSAETVKALYRANLPQSGAVRLSARGIRRWPDGRLLPHTLGYTGRITADQWPKLREKGVAMDATVGQAGLEAVYDDLLRGVPGEIRISTNRRSGAVESAVQLSSAVPGATLQLALDSELQAVLQKALPDQITTLQATKAAGAGREARAGAAVVVDVATGGILAAANCPGYDLTRYRTDYAALAADPGAPLLDRVSQGLYAPGSAFKPAVAVAALRSGIDPYETVRCGGVYTYYGSYRPRCLQYGHSGSVNMILALTHSCNIYFYDVGRRLGVDVFSTTARQLGLASPSGAELPAASGRLTLSTDGNYTAGLTPQAAIGQGNTAVTPLQLAAYAATLATGGARPTLHFAEKAVDAAGNTVWRYEPQIISLPGGEAVFGPVQQGMRQMAQTLRVLRESPVPCAAKTGSPQLPGTLADGSHYTNSVLIGYAPADDPQIAVSVVIEYGGGGANAAPILRAVLDAYAGIYE